MSFCLLIAYNNCAPKSAGISVDSREGTYEVLENNKIEKSVDTVELKSKKEETAATSSITAHSDQAFVDRRAGSVSTSASGKDTKDVADNNTGGGGNNGSGNTGSTGFPTTSPGGTAQICNGREHCLAMKILTTGSRFSHGDEIDVEVSARGIVEGTCSTVGPGAIMDYSKVKNGTHVVKARLSNPSRIPGVNQNISIGCRRQNSQADIIQQVTIAVLSYYATEQCRIDQAAQAPGVDFECGYLFERLPSDPF